MTKVITLRIYTKPTPYIRTPELHGSIPLGDLERIHQSILDFLDRIQKAVGDEVLTLEDFMVAGREVQSVVFSDDSAAERLSELISEAQVVKIIADDENAIHIPWEIFSSAPPSTPATAANFWGARHVFLRTFSKTTGVRKLRLSQSRLPLEAGMLKYDGTPHIEEIHHQLVDLQSSNFQLTETTPPRSDYRAEDLPGVVGFIKGLDIAHLNCLIVSFLYGEEPYLVFSDAFLVSLSDLKRSLRFERSPIVFLDASDNTWRMMNARFRFLTSLIEYGSSAIVSSFFPVPRVLATAFAKRFYEELAAGRAIPAHIALGKARQALLEEGQPLALLFWLYGDSESEVNILAHKSSSFQVQGVHQDMPQANESDMFTWLHLSDLHFETDEQRGYQIKTVINALKYDLKKMQDKGIKFNAVFFTGDLAHKSGKDEFNSAWADGLIQIANECGLQSKDIFIVPGNHDINRGQVAMEDSNLIRSYTDASQIYALLHDPTRKHLHEYFLQRMDNYVAFQRSITGLSYPAEALSWGSTIPTAGGRHVGIIGLNSVWASASVKGDDGEVDDQGKLIVGLPLVQSAFEQIVQAKLKPKPELYITLMHHPLHWLQNWDRKDISQFLSENSRFVLHGHIHETTIDYLADPSQKTMVISAGTLFKKYERGDLYSCLHAYNIVQFDLANSEGVMYFRRYDPVHSRYGIDDTTFRDMVNGEYRFRYAADGFRSNNDPK